MKEQIDQSEELARDIYDSAFVSEAVSLSLAIDLAEKGYRKQSEWISVEDRLPPEKCRVLVYSPTDGINLGHRLDEVGRFYVTKPYPDHPTHWMPLPEAPKGGE